MLNIIGVGLYGLMAVAGKTKKTIRIPGRLMIESDEMQVANINGDDYLVSQNDMQARFEDDGMMISYSGNADFKLEIIGG